MKQAQSIGRESVRSVRAAVNAGSASAGLPESRAPLRWRRLRWARLSVLALAWPAVSCTGVAVSPPAASAPSVAYVDPALEPRQDRFDGDPRRRTISASADRHGVISDFFDGIVRLQPRSPDELQAFLRDYDGEVLSSTEPSPAARAHFGAEWRPLAGAPRYTVRVDLRRAHLERLETNARATGLSEPIRFSSQRGLETFSLIVDAAARGYAVAGDFLDYPQDFPETLFATSESPASPPSDGFQESRYGAGADLAGSNIIPAWQFVAAHGIERRVKVAIVDRGYWLNRDGSPAGTDSDFPAVVEQYDLVADDGVAAGASSGECSGQRCDWHGTGSAGVAVGVSNEGRGRAGVGWLVGDPFLIKRDDGYGGREDAIALAFGRGADVVNVSSGSNCNYWCRQFQVGSVIPDHIAEGGLSVVVASAGNDQQTVGDPNYYHPCTLAHVICVGALGDASVSRDTSYSNFGERVDVFAPSNVMVMPRPPANGPGPATFYTHGGTSAAAPVVSGVVAMMKAINPALGPDQIAQMLRSTARPGTSGATRVLDALAAVRAAAAGIPPVPDRFGIAPIDLGAVSSRTEEDLNVTPGDPDVVRFTTEGASNTDITLTFAKDLGQIWVEGDLADSDSCPRAELVGLADPGPMTIAPNSTPQPGEYRQARTYSYRMGGGEHRMVLRADDLNAYDVSVTVTPAAVPPDPLEANETFATARLFGFLGLAVQDTTRDLTIHTPGPGAAGDVDVFRIRGSMDHDFSGGGFGYEVVSFPALQVWQNEAPLTVSVHERNFDGTPGAPVVANLRLAPCSPDPIQVPLALGERYFVTVAGQPGRYRLSVGSFFTVERLNYFNLEDVLKRPGPIEIAREVQFILPPDPALGALTVDDAQVHVQAIDVASGRIAAEGRRAERGERLDLSRLDRGVPYVLSLTRIGEAREARPVTLEWEAASLVRGSANLLQSRRGRVAGSDGDAASFQRPIALPDAWLGAIRRGRVKAALSGFPASGSAGLSLAFVDRNGRVLATTARSFETADAPAALPGELREAIEATVPRLATGVILRLETTARPRERPEESPDSLSLVLLEYGG